MGLVLQNLVSLLVCMALGACPALGETPNFLFIIVDDLNDMLSVLDSQQGLQARTPNLERLAARGMVFRRAFANSSLCNPSRFSMLTARLASQTGVYTNLSDSLALESPPENIMTYLRKYSYRTIGIGKIFHGKQNQISAWDEYYDYPLKANLENYASKEWPLAWAMVDTDNYDDRDEQATEQAIKLLEKDFGSPTFLALGFHSPHLPWLYLPEDLEKYPYPQIEIPPQPEYDLDDLPKAGRDFAMKSNSQCPDSHYHEKIIAAGEWKHAIQAYLIEISHLDSLLGKVLDALEQGPNNDDTIIFFLSDHGYHIGEKQHWNKHALWSKTTHIPLIISVPSALHIHGLSDKAQFCDRTVSLVDIFPTIVELSAIRKRSYEAGHSLVPLLRNPKAYWPYPVTITMGYKNHSILTERWRYIRYKDGSEELYDERFDPNNFYNLIQLSSLRELISNLKTLIPKTNARAIPENPKFKHE